MVTTSDFLTILFGLTATALAVGGIWATARRYNTITELDVELGLLHRASPPPTTNNAESDEGGLPIPAPNAADDKHKLHQVISDALEVFSRHLRAHN